MTREEAIRWLEETIQDTDAYWNSCSEALQRELDEQKEVFLMALSALRSPTREQESTLTPPNEALTLEQLREMCGCPVFVISKDTGGFWALVNMNSVYVDTKKCFFFDDMSAEYGKTWIAYRRPPEGEA